MAFLDAEPDTKIHGVMAFCKRHNSLLTGIVLVLGIIGTCLTVYYAHKKAQTQKGPFHTDIMAIENEEQRHDLKELEYLWQIARRKTIKEMLNHELKKALSPQTDGSALPPDTAPNESTNTSGKGDNDGVAESEDPYFTPA